MVTIYERDTIEIMGYSIVENLSVVGIKQKDTIIIRKGNFIACYRDFLAIVKLYSISIMIINIIFRYSYWIL